MNRAERRRQARQATRQAVSRPRRAMLDDDMVADVFERRPVARKIYCCSGCGKPIRPGQHYRRLSVKSIYGQFYTYTLCLEAGADAAA